ncbi:MAG: HindIII family type II restriction endonuclease [Victivallaceae bacterium]|nr:HindIII family type II restriction endonuclease [Victivallaceae bacterium]
MSDTFFIQKFVDLQFSSGRQIDHELIAREFLQKIDKEMHQQRFEDLLIISGFIPDLYPSDSSEETLFSKLVECLVAEWARRMGFLGEIIKQKASYEDIRITIGKNVVVCDAKSFRLGRSQQAPNAKDFLKLEDIRKWMDRYPASIGGLVTYPCKHEWTGKSDIYQYCSTKDAPTVMLPYKYLAFLLHNKSSYDTSDLIQLWDYARIFPNKLTKDMPGGNRVAYWKQIDKEIVRITKTSAGDLVAFMSRANTLIAQCVAENERALQSTKQQIITRIMDEVGQENNIAIIKNKLIEYMVKTETTEIDQMLSRIRDFRQ